MSDEQDTIRDSIKRDIPESKNPPPPPGDDLESMDKSLLLGIPDEELRKRVDKYLTVVDVKLGLRALEHEDHKPVNKIEEILHYMRWQPDYLFDCSIRQLHEYEMILASMLLYIQDKENKWQIQARIANRKLARVKKLAARFFKGKSVGEREATAMNSIQELRDVESKLEIYNIYTQKCEGLVDVFTQLDNSLKKTLDRRRMEELFQFKKENPNAKVTGNNGDLTY